MAVSISIFIFIPCAFISMWICQYNMVVKQNIIQCRNIFGIKKQHTFDDIDRVIWRKNVTKFGNSDRITIIFKKGRFSAETSMIGFDKLSKHIEANVSQDKIKMIYRNFSK